MPKIYITGTCPDCNGRYRLDAEEIMKASRVSCPNCGIRLNTFVLKMYAEELLKANKK